MGISRFTVAKAWYFMQTQPLLGPWPWSQKVDLFKAYVSMGFFQGNSCSRNHGIHHQYAIWLVVYLPPCKIWVRQLGWWTSQYDGKVIKFHGSSHHPSVNGLSWKAWACQLPTLVESATRNSFEFPSQIFEVPAPGLQWLFAHFELGHQRGIRGQIFIPRQQAVDTSEFQHGKDVTRWKTKDLATNQGENQLCLLLCKAEY